MARPNSSGRPGRSPCQNGIRPGCPGAGAWHRRISLTPAGLAPTHTRLLLLRGAAKRARFEEALAGDNVQEMPVRLAFLTPGAALQVYWAP